MFELVIRYQSVFFDKEEKGSCNQEGIINPEVKFKILNFPTRDHCLTFIENFITCKRILLSYKINRYISTLDTFVNVAK